MRLLVVEDNPKLAGLLVDLLHDQSYAVDAAATVEEARAALDVATYDLIVLDLALPDGDGTTVLRELRRSGQGVPVLVVTARTEVAHRVKTLDQGADDYLVKPFSPQELLARVRALLRRPREALNPVITAGNVALDIACFSVTVGDIAVEMPRRELMVLQVLMRNHGRLVSRRALEEAIYSFDTDVTPNAIEVAISRVRKRLEGSGASVAVTTMRGLGYILADKEA
jgi:DNA-binding response OmpR family regulator